MVAWGTGKVEEAVTVFREALSLLDELGDSWGASVSLGFLGLLFGEQGDVARAAQAHHRALELRWQVEAWEDIAGSVADIAALAATVENFTLAAQLLGAAYALRRDIGVHAMLPERAVFERAEQRARRALGDPTFEEHCEHGRSMRREDAVDKALRLVAKLAAEQRER